jgi:adenylate cyclase
MNTRSRIILVLFFYGAGICCVGAQYPVVDSLQRLLDGVSGAPDRKVDLLLALGDEFMGNNVDRAAQCGEEAAQLAQEIAYLKGQARAAYLNARIKMRKGAFEEAVQLIDQGQANAQVCDDPFLVLQGERFRAMAVNTLVSTDTALAVIDNAVRTAEQINDLQEKGRLLIVKIALLKLQAKFYESIKIAEVIEPIFKEKGGDERYLADLYNNWGRCLHDLGNTNGALEKYFAGLVITKRYYLYIYEARILSGLGIIYEDTKEYKKAIDVYEQSLALAQKTNDMRSQAVAHEYKGVAYSKMKDFPNAIASLNESIKISEAVKSKESLVYCYASLGTIYFETGDRERGATYTQKALQLNLEVKDATIDFVAYSALGDEEEKIKNYAKAVEYWQKAYNAAKPTGNIINTEQATAKLARGYAHLGAYEEAYNYSKEAATLRDSIFNIGKDKTIRELQQNHELDNKNREIALQKSELAANVATIGRQRILQIALLLGLILAGILAYVWWRAFRIRTDLNRRLKVEKQNSDNLLLNILPAAVAEELKAKQKYTARSADQVTVLCTDFCGFTQISERLSPEDLVTLIDEYFSEFDVITTRYKIEKIKTMGDAYMCASGLANADDPNAVLRAALDMQKFMNQQKSIKKAANKPYFECRIGVHTGPVVAGIVGIKKFAYDIWGDTVNTATRMEQHSEAGQINISAITQRLIEPSILTEYRGEMEVKGKGNIGMYFVNQ